MRPILVVLLVLYHAFAIFGGGWDPIEGYPEIHAYWWLDKLSYAFLLEAFVFVSGYVFGFQVRTKGESKLDIKSLIPIKIKRLIIPSMVFSLLYIYLFSDIRQPVLKTLYEILCGYAHLWFLPMLFWCFLGVCVIEKLKMNRSAVFLLLLLCSLFSFIPLPLQLNSSLYYLPFFYVGYLLQRKLIEIKPYYNKRSLILLIILFVVLFPLLTIFRMDVSEIVLSGKWKFIENELVQKAIVALFFNLTRLVYSSLGVILMFLTVCWIDNNRQKPLSNGLLLIGNLSMGVYIFQQFILKGLYIKTSLPSVISPYWLPWIGFIIALAGSLLLSYLFRITRVGRFLIG